MKIGIELCIPNWLRCWTCLLLTLLTASGCDEFISDAVWIQERSIIVGNSDVKQCVESALTEIPNVTIDHVDSTLGDIALKVQFEKPMPSLGIFVRYSDSGNVKVMFVGKGLTEPDSYREAITPVLTSIANSIGSKCSVARAAQARKAQGLP